MFRLALTLCVAQRQDRPGKRFLEIPVHAALQSPYFAIRPDWGQDGRSVFNSPMAARLHNKQVAIPASLLD